MIVVENADFLNQKIVFQMTTYNGLINHDLSIFFIHKFRTRVLLRDTVVKLTRLGWYEGIFEIGCYFENLLAIGTATVLLTVV